jgi:hypothetical protein
VCFDCYVYVPFVKFMYSYYYVRSVLCIVSLCCSVYFFIVLFCVLFVLVCTVLPPGVNPVAINQYIISFAENWSFATQRHIL